MHRSTTRTRQLAALLLIMAAVGCNEEPPNLLPIGNREVWVNQSLEFIVAAQSPTGSNLEFSASNLPPGASFVQFGPTQARFQWTPTAADIGETYVDFRVSHDKHVDSEKVIITVRGEVEGGPQFVGPSTWTLEVDQKSIERVMEVRDTSSSSFDWSIDNAPAGAAFTPLIRQAVFFWEPTREQRAEPQYSFTITVRNEHGKEASRVFTILIRDSGGGVECPGSKPAVESTTPATMQGANAFEVTGTAHDSQGEIVSVTLRWSDTEDTPLAEYRSVVMDRAGDTSYRAVIRLQRDLEPGAYLTISYLICAVSDQGEGCQQESCTQRHSFTAQMRGGGGLCSECTSDGECGGEHDLCVQSSMPGEMFCAIDCRTTSSCPTGYTCTDMGRDQEQCVPLSGSCVQSSHRRARPGEVVVNEILPAPPFGQGGDANGDGVASTRADEFVELVSVALFPLDLGGFTISDRLQVRYTFPMGTVIPAGGAIVVFGGGDPSTFRADFGGAQVFSVLPNNPDGHGLQLRDAGDDVILRDPDFGLIAAGSYPDVRDIPASERGSFTLEPQSTGIVYVPIHEAQGATGEKFMPGRQHCGKPFPIATHGACPGRTCGDRTPNVDMEPNNSRALASCISERAVELEGHLTYHGSFEETHPGPDPADFYVFRARAGDRIDAVTFPCDHDWPVFDTYLEILDASGRVIAENDDHEGLSDALYAEILDFPISETGTYYLVVRTYQGTRNDIGCYKLWLLLVP